THTRNLRGRFRNRWSGRLARPGRRPADRNCGEHSGEKAVPIGSNQYHHSVRRVAGRHRRVARATKSGVSPPIEIQVWLVAAPVYHQRREVVVDHVAVAEEHVLIALAAVVVPQTQTIVAVTIDGPVGVPGPVALDDLRAGLERDAGVAVARTLRGRAHVARDVLDAKSGVGIGWPPLRQ